MCVLSFSLYFVQVSHFQGAMGEFMKCMCLMTCSMSIIHVVSCCGDAFVGSDDLLYSHISVVGKGGVKLSTS